MQAKATAIQSRRATRAMLVAALACGCAALADAEPENAEREAAASPVRLVELPPDGLPGLAGQRRHHALSVRSELPERMLRSIGVEASECATRFRAPSKLRQEAGGGTSVVVQAQIGLACRF